MSIHIVYGKPGSGKSRYGVGKLIEQLLETDAVIGTNFPLEIPRLNQYLQERYPNKEIDIFKRIFIIPDDDLRNFFEWFGPPEPDAPQGISVPGRRIIYHIDEAQIPFNSLDFAKQTSGGVRKCFNFLTQHRKTPADVWAYTQHYDNLDLQFRRLAQDFRQCVNHRLKKLGVFRGFDKFKCHHYEKESRKQDDAYYVEEYTIDPKGIGSCYDTARGIGVKGVGADKGSRAKGLTLGWGVVGCFMLAFCVFGVPWACSRGYKSYTEKKNSALAQKNAKDDSGAASLPKQVMNEKQPSKFERMEDNRENVLWVNGYIVRGTRVQVFLSDGRTLDEHDPALGNVHKNHVFVDGKKIYRRPPVTKDLTRQIVAPALKLPDNRDEHSKTRQSNTDRQTTATQKNTGEPS